MKTLLFILASLFGSAVLAGPDTCSCAAAFQELTAKLETNYIAYHLTKTDSGTVYETRKAGYILKAAQTEPGNCTALFQEFLEQFGDGHLFVVEYPQPGDPAVAAYKNKLQAQRFDPGKLVITGNSGLEGYWTDGTTVFAITGNPDNAEEVLAVIISDKEVSKNGEIKFRVRKRNGTWTGTYYSNKYIPRYVKLDAYRENTLLSIWGGLLWGKLADKNAPLYDPAIPAFRQTDPQTVCLTIPSFLIGKPTFDSILNLHDKQLRNATNLVIDLRGNSGGNGIYFNLLTYYYDHPGKSSQGYAISSPDNIAYFSRFAGKSKNDPYKTVVEAMQKNAGAVVPGPAFEALKLKKQKNKIRKVIILTDEGNMSAAESFILYSKSVSSKVITMGAATGGVIDYNNVNMIPVGCTSQGIYFGYPMYSMTATVHQGTGFNKTGIVPDVVIPAGTRDVMEFIKGHINNQAK